MTAASLMCFADRVTIAADTRVYDDLGETVGYAAKIYALPHLRAGVFCRGKLSITLGVVTKLLLSPQIHSFDDAAAAIGDLYREVTDAWCGAVGFDRTGQRLHEGMLAGWSESERRMRLVFHSCVDNFEPHFEDAYGGPVAWPRVPASFIPAAKSTDSSDDRLRDILLGIDAWCVEHPKETNGSRLGGQMLAMDLAESGIASRCIGTFPGYSQPKPQSSSADSKRTAVRKAQRAARKGRR
jgi:hypothetical protein